MSWLRAYGHLAYWRHGFSFSSLMAYVLAAVGAMWTVTEVLIFMELSTKTTQLLRTNWWIFLVAGVAWALWKNRPRHAVSCTLKNRGVRIEVRVGDLFAGDTSLVIGCNTSFDTDINSNLISPKSIQGQFTSRYYANVAHLDADIDAALKLPTAPPPTTTAQPGKRGKQLIYPIGTTVTVRNRRTAYLCAITHMNSHGNAHATFEDIKDALPQLWDHISSGGDHGDIAVPILGSGFARVAVNKEDLIHELLRSFIAACAAQRPCSTLTVVIRPDDFYKEEINLQDLGDFLQHLCRYTNLASAGASGTGRALPATSSPSTTGVAPPLSGSAVSTPGGTRP